jgi:hypothetical protein
MTGLILYEKLIFQATCLGSCGKLTPIEIILILMLTIGVCVAVLLEAFLHTGYKPGLLPQAF